MLLSQLKEEKGNLVAYVGDWLASWDAHVIICELTQVNIGLLATRYHRLNPRDRIKGYGVIFDLEEIEHPHISITTWRLFRRGQ